MDITMFSIIMALIWFNAGIIIISLLRRNGSFIRVYGIRILFALVLGCLLRIIITVELPFVKVIRSKEIYPYIVSKLHSNLSFFEYSFPFSLLELMIYISVLVSLFLFTYQTLKYLRFRINIKHFSSDITEMESNVYFKILNELNIHKAPTVIKNSSISSPCITGFFKPVILLPEDDFTELELSYIFKHELTHYINHDIWIKLIVNYICNIFWWNIPVYLLKKDIGQILEIKCDISICDKLSEFKKVEYSSTILKVIKNIAEPTETCYYTSAMSIKGKNGMRTKQRLEIILSSYNLKKKKQMSIFVSGILILMFIGSYSFVLQPYNNTPSIEEIDGETLFINPENTSIKVVNGRVQLYINGEFYRVIDESELEDFKMQGIPISR